MRSRSELVKALINFSEPLSTIMNELKNYAWGGEVLVILEPKHILNILKRYTESYVTKPELEAWANAIECRDDVGFLESHEEILKECIYFLANTEINHPINSELVKKLSNSLRA